MFEDGGNVFTFIISLVFGLAIFTLFAIIVGLICIFILSVAAIAMLVCSIKESEGIGAVSLSILAIAMFAALIMVLVMFLQTDMILVGITNRKKKTKNLLKEHWGLHQILIL